MNLKFVTGNSYRIYLHSNDYFPSSHVAKGMSEKLKNTEVAVSQLKKTGMLGIYRTF